MSNQNGPTTVNVPAPKMYPCLIVNDFASVSVKSLNTGKEVLISVENAPALWDIFNAEEKAFLDTLAGEMALTGQQMREILRLSQYAEKREYLNASGVNPTPLTMPTVASLRQEVAENVQKDHSEELADIARQERLARDAKRRAEDRSPLYHLTYYVPALVSLPVAEGGHGKFANIASRVRNFAIPFDGSNWTIKTENGTIQAIKQEFADWNAQDFVQATKDLPEGKGNLLVDIDIIQYHETQLEKIRNRSYNKLRGYIRDLHLALMEKVEGATRRMQAAEEALVKEKEEGKEGWTSKKGEELRNKRINALSVALHYTRNHLQDTLTAAEAFEETDSLNDIVSALRKAIHLQEASLATLRRAEKDYRKANKGK